MSLAVSEPLRPDDIGVELSICVLVSAKTHVYSSLYGRSKFRDFVVQKGIYFIKAYITYI